MATDNESRAIDEVVERIAARFPNVPPDEIVAAVQARLERFDDAPVRDFVPMLVERQAIEDLARGTH